jgi:hypothetical protein
MEKIFNQKNFNNFVWSPLGSLLGVCSLILFPLFATGVNNTRGTGDKICQPVWLILVANFPPVSLIPVAICHRCHLHRLQICTGVVDTCGAP